MLTEVKAAGQHYFEDELGQAQGQFKSWYPNGQPWIHCMAVDDREHGEYKVWYNNGVLIHHMFYVRGVDITDEVDAVVEDMHNITDEERLLIKIQWGIECLPTPQARSLKDSVL